MTPENSITEQMSAEQRAGYALAAARYEEFEILDAGILWVPSGSPYEYPYMVSMEAFSCTCRTYTRDAKLCEHIHAAVAYLDARQSVEAPLDTWRGRLRMGQLLELMRDVAEPPSADETAASAYDLSLKVSGWRYSPWWLVAAARDRHLSLVEREESGE